MPSLERTSGHRRPSALEQIDVVTAPPAASRPRVGQGHGLLQGCDSFSQRDPKSGPPVGNKHRLAVALVPVIGSITPGQIWVSTEQRNSKFPASSAPGHLDE